MSKNKNSRELCLAEGNSAFLGGHAPSKRTLSKEEIALNIKERRSRFSR